jgi:hypothetical protein
MHLLDMVISDKNYHLPMSYKFLSVLTRNSDFKSFVSDQNCHFPVNYNFLLVIT